jgi:uroporphyrin-III C-methyltransferase
MRSRLRVLSDNEMLARRILRGEWRTTSPLARENRIHPTRELEFMVCRGKRLSISEKLECLSQEEVDVVLNPASELPYPLPAEIEVVALCDASDRRPHGGNSAEEVLMSPDWQAVLSKRRRPELQALFQHLDIRQQWGKVWLVGFGPGDPELMTLKADRILSQADIIYFDDLIDQAVLSRYRGEKKYVGKRKGTHSESQQTINELLFRSALAGRNVVRLKGGDPFIFGRGGEEIEYLFRRFVAVEVIPGVSAANAAAAAGNIPLTKRAISSRVSFRTAHCGKDQVGVHTSGGTLVYYMAASRLAELSRDLILEGWNSATPVALVQNASLATERCLSTTLEHLAGEIVDSPVLVIVGEVAAGHRRVRTLIYTGSDLSQARFAERLFHYPLERAGDSLVSKPVGILPSSALEWMDGIVFGSVLAVEAFLQRHGALPGWWLIYAMNRATLKKLLSHDVLREQIILLEDKETFGLWKLRSA